MGLFDKIRKMPLGLKIIYSVIAAAVVAAVVVCVVFARGNYLATTMRLLRVEGTVNIEDSKGGTKPVMENIRFQSGDALNTGSDGLASVGLDDTKIITLQSDSRAEFSKKSKQLELKLTKGALFFEVTEHLKEDESFDIKTSTMTAGIRGTSGMVFYDKEGRDSLIVTDGKVIVTATNPETGETKYAEVVGGQIITVYLYSYRLHDTVDFEVEDIKPSDLPILPLKVLSENEELLDRVCEFTGWDKTELREIIDKAIVLKIGGDDITDTPTPSPDETTAETTGETPAPTPDVSGTPTPALSETPTPTPGATGTSTPSPSATATPSAKATATPSVNATATPTVKATSTPTTKVTATPTSKVTATPTAKSTSTATPTPSKKPTVSPTPSVTNTNTPTPTNTNTPTPTNSPTPTPVPGYETLPEGFTKTSMWGYTYNGHKVYIASIDNEEFIGYYNDDWISLEQEGLEEDDGYRITFYGMGVIYYSELIPYETDFEG